MFITGGSFNYVPSAKYTPTARANANTAPTAPTAPTAALYTKDQNV